MTETRQGYRTFECQDCEHTWEEATRDHTSPSGDGCPKCIVGWARVIDSRSDPTLPVDEFGNLRSTSG
jgi:Zn finger protein HypA/HybF involved in hydrogenase expression